MNEFSDWVIGQVDATAAAPAVGIQVSGGDVLLSWTHRAANSGGYDVWYSTDPYFTPGTDCAAPPAGLACQHVAAPGATFPHTGAAADTAHNYTYIVLGINTAGARSSGSQRAAEFSFTLVPGQ